MCLSISIHIIFRNLKLTKSCNVLSCGEIFFRTKDKKFLFEETLKILITIVLIENNIKISSLLPLAKNPLSPTKYTVFIHTHSLSPIACNVFIKILFLKTKKLNKTKFRA